MHTFIYNCMCVHMFELFYGTNQRIYACLLLCKYICVRVCICVCVCLHVCVNICMYAKCHTMIHLN